MRNEDWIERIKNLVRRMPFKNPKKIADGGNASIWSVQLPEPDIVLQSICGSNLKEEQKWTRLTTICKSRKCNHTYIMKIMCSDNRPNFEEMVQKEYKMTVKYMNLGLGNKLYCLLRTNFQGETFSVMLFQKMLGSVWDLIARWNKGKKKPMICLNLVLIRVLELITDPKFVDDPPMVNTDITAPNFLFWLNIKEEAKRLKFDCPVSIWEISKPSSAYEERKLYCAENGEHKIALMTDLDASFFHEVENMHIARCYNVLAFCSSLFWGMKSDENIKDLLDCNIPLACVIFLNAILQTHNRKRFLYLIDLKTLVEATRYKNNKQYERNKRTWWDGLDWYSDNTLMEYPEHVRNSKGYENDDEVYRKSMIQYSENFSALFKSIFPRTLHRLKKDLSALNATQRAKFEAQLTNNNGVYRKLNESFNHVFHGRQNVGMLRDALNT